MKNKRLQKNKTSIVAGLITVFAFMAVFGFSFLNGGESPLNTSKAEGSMNLYWSDDFDGTGLDTSRWKPYYNTYGDGNNEEACLTPNNIEVGSGTLKIIAKKEHITCPGQPQDDFSSGFMGSREAGHYYPAFAKYEIRAKVPHGQGLWPAFWLRHVNGSSTVEIDIMEYFHSQVPGKVTQSLHIPNEEKYNLSKKITAFETPVTGTGGWHTYAVDIVPLDDGTKARIDYYIDNNLTHTYTPSKFGWLNDFNQNAMFDVAINMAVGGNWVGHPDDELGWSRYLNQCINEYPYGPSPCPVDKGVLRAKLPGVYEVDYVKVFVPSDGGGQANKLDLPTSLVATASDGQVKLDWAQVPNADNYTVRWGQNGEWSSYSNDPGFSNPTTSSYTVTGLTNGQTYIFSVAARESTGTYIKGDYSNAVTASPAAPGNTSDINADGTIDIVDLSILLSNWGPTGSTSDINSDGKVDIIDLSILLSAWG